MAHSHQHQSTSGNLKLAFFLNLGFAILEIIGGILTNSIAITSDALHDLGDSFSLGLAWWLNRKSEAESDEKYTYGYQRFSLLGAVINAVILIVGSLIILSEAVPRLLNPETSSATGMIGFAILGIVVNGFAAWRLQGGSSLNVQVIGWHLLEDVLGWVAVLIVGIILLFVDAPILDPLLSILITAYILYNVVKKLQDAVRLFLQGSPLEVDVTEIQSQLEAINGVQSVHHTHIWSLDGEHNVFTTHLVVDNATSRDDYISIKQQAAQIVQPLHLEHATIEIEYPDRRDCSQAMIES